MPPFLVPQGSHPRLENLRRCAMLLMAVELILALPELVVLFKTIPNEDIPHEPTTSSAKNSFGNETTSGTKKINEQATAGPDVAGNQTKSGKDKAVVSIFTTLACALIDILGIYATYSKKRNLLLLFILLYFFGIVVSRLVAVICVFELASSHGLIMLVHIPLCVACLVVTFIYYAVMDKVLPVPVNTGPGL